MEVMASIASHMLLWLFIVFVCVRAQTQPPELIKLGSSLSTNGSTLWYSSSTQFAFGFYPQRNSFAVGILLLSTDNIVVWTANRDDDPLVTSNATLQLTKNGELLLRTMHGQDKLIASGGNNFRTVSSASMLDSGNFVLYDNNSRVVWQSFDYPTDTILGGQILHAGAQLVSSSSEIDQSSGRFCLRMQSDGNLVLYPADIDIPSKENSLWDSNSYGHGGNSQFQLYLNKTGPLVIVNRSNLEIATTLSSLSLSLGHDLNDFIYRATLDSDGIFRLYAHSFYHVATLWSALENACQVKSFCGLNSYCTYTNHQAICNCIPGTDFIDRNQTILGCQSNISGAEYCRVGKQNAASYEKLSKMDDLIWNFRPYSEAEMTEEKCPSSCLEDCLCGVAFYYQGTCKKQMLPLKYVRINTAAQEYFTDLISVTAFFKVGIRIPRSSNDTPPIPEPYQPPPIRATSKKAIVQIFLVILAFAFLFCSTLAISSHFIYKMQVWRYKRLLEIGDLGLNEGVTLRVFSYKELKRATNGFRQELGKGHFGAVYRGTLNKGRKLIAVKRLEKLVEEGEREFQSEMRAIGKTHHRNLVRLLGYCAEGSKRLLVYEYMSNGSLADLLFGNIRRPDWDERRKIALDVARGILYLHEECDAPIIHCDIKPQNILMDEFWTAKISDFGLAKLLMPDQTRTFTQVRGTRGYVAPEWQKTTPITVKADVYSYGIMLLEILFCRKNLVVNVSEPEQIVLSSWVYKCFNEREFKKLVPSNEQVDNMLLENMVKVGLWCIQDESFLRPTMKSVVLMLEGVTDVSIPPCPSSNSL